MQLKPGTARSALLPKPAVSHCHTLLAAFEVPRFIAYRNGFPRTASNKIEKRILTAGIHNVTADSGDAEAR